MKKRVERLRKAFIEAGIEGMLIISPENRFYLSGFTGTAGVLLITMEEAWLITDFRYVEQAREQSPHFQVVQHGYPLEKTLKELIEKSKISILGFEGDKVTYRQHEVFREALKTELKPTREIVEKLRLIKDVEEIKLIREAARIADEAFEKILPLLKPGVKEEEVALELEFIMRRSGAGGAAFDFIVASGVRSSLPHGVASDKKLEYGELVTIDFGALYKGYNSDMTRTVALGKINEKLLEIYNIVLEAQVAALGVVKPGIKASELDKTARDIIDSKGYGENFGHSLGHGVGLAVHEKPTVSRLDDTILESGMVITIEPGIYLPGLGGVRIEDLVVVTEYGPEILTHFTKQLIII